MMEGTAAAGDQGLCLQVNKNPSPPYIDIPSRKTCHQFPLSSSFLFFRPLHCLSMSDTEQENSTATQQSGSKQQLGEDTYGRKRRQVSLSLHEF